MTQDLLLQCDFHSAMWQLLEALDNRPPSPDPAAPQTVDLELGVPLNCAARRREVAAPAKG